MPVVFWGGTESQKVQWNWYMNYASSESPLVRNFLNTLLKEPVLVQPNSRGETYYDNGSGVLHWDPSKAHIIETVDGKIETVSPGRAALHELFHRYSPQILEEDEVLAREFENQVARELGEPLRSNRSQDLGFVTVKDVSAHTVNGKWVTVDPDSFAKVMGPNFDPNNPNPVVVIGTEDQPGGGNGGEESGGSGSSGNSGGGGTTGSGGGNPNVEVIPDPPGPPIREHEEIIYNPNPETDAYSGVTTANKSDNEIIYSPDSEIIAIEVIGIADPSPIF